MPLPTSAVAMARPLYTASPAWSLLPTSAVVPRAPRQPEITPASLEKRNRSPWKSAALVLDTVPVGAPLGIATRSACLVPSALYRVDRSVPLSATHQGLVGRRLRPQPFTRSASGVGPVASTSTLYLFRSLAATGMAATRMRPIAAKSAKIRRFAIGHLRPVCDAARVGGLDVAPMHRATTQGLPRFRAA